jgi:hypothetical protein
MSESTLPKLIFVCGTPRSGVDLMLDFLSASKSAGWIPEKLALNPTRLSYARQIHKLCWPLLGEFFLERRYAWDSVAIPAPANTFLHAYLSNFQLGDREYTPPGPEHVKEGEAERLREVLTDIANIQRRNNLLIGYYGFPRVRMLRSIFPEARFMHCIRDPRTLAYRMMMRMQKSGDAFFQKREEIIPHMPEPLQDRLRDLPDVPLAFCGAFIRWFHEAYKEEMEELPENYRIEISYSDLFSRPEYTCKRAMKFAGYPYDKRFKYYLKFHDIQASNQRTNRNLSDEDAEILAQAVAPIE